MKITHLALQGFRSFQEEQSVSVPNGAGLVFVGGRNDVEPRLGSNGVGKSSMGEALVWCFFGVASTGLKSPVLRARDCEYPMSVTVNFERNGQAYTLTRTHKPNTLLLDDGLGPKTVEQSVVTDVVGVPLSTFTHCVFFGQNNQGYFSDLSSAEALTLLTDVLDLSKWDESANNAKEAANEARTELNEAKTNVRVHSNAVRSSKATVVQMKDSLAELERVARNANKQAKQELEAAHKERDEYEERLDTLKVRYDEVFPLSERLTSQAEEILERMTPLDKQARKLLMEQGALDSDLKHARVQLKEAKENLACTVCGQDFPKDARKQLILDLQNNLDECEASAAKVRKKLAKTTEALSVDRKLADKVGKRLSAAKSDVRSVLIKIEQTERAMTSLGKTIAGIKERGPVVREETLTAAKDKIKSAKKVVKDTKSKLKRSEKRVESWANRLDITTFWHKEFRRIRFWVLKSALLELSVHTENSLRELGLAGWKITYEVNLESARPVFKASILSPKIDGPLPLSSYSGGEAQRLKIAAEVALCELVRNRCGFFPNIEFWDEPTPHLSVDGVADLMAYMKERSKEFGLQVWIVDHRMPASAAFDSEILVTKTTKGSTISLKS